MELFTDAATDHEFSAITGQIPGEAQKKQVREQLENNPEANAECMAWLYTLRGDSAGVSEILKTLPKDARRNSRRNSPWWPRILSSFTRRP